MCLIAVLGCLHYSWLVSSDVEHLVCLLANCLSSIVNCLQLSLATFICLPFSCCIVVIIYVFYVFVREQAKVLPLVQAP